MASLKSRQLLEVIRLSEEMRDLARRTNLDIEGLFLARPDLATQAPDSSEFAQFQEEFLESQSTERLMPPPEPGQAVHRLPPMSLLLVDRSSHWLVTDDMGTVEISLYMPKALQKKFLSKKSKYLGCLYVVYRYSPTIR